MRMFKKGFTLTEVLIALLILGIISAILMPVVVNDVQKKQSVSTLARIIGQIENGNQDLIQYVNSQSIDGSITDNLATVTLADLGGEGGGSGSSILAANLQNSVRSFWGISRNVVTISPAILTFKGETFSEATLSDNYSLSKFSAGVSIVTPEQPIYSNDVGAETGYVIYIDTNGWTTKPNKVGKDIFSFKLLNNGKLIPNMRASYKRGEESTSGDYAQRILEDGFRINYY